MLQRAREKGLIDIRLTDMRDFAQGKHRKVDDRPFGGGPGMVLMPEPVTAAIESVRTQETHVVYLSPQGRPLNAALCAELAGHKHLVLVCGHYEGLDERVIESAIDEEISIGDYVLTSGCPAAIVLVDAVSRFIPGVIGHEEAVEQDSFQEGRFDAPHYTKPLNFRGKEVPEVLRGGNHAVIAQWRKEKALEKTRRVRPELLIGE